jgi:hypothetical protein
MNILRTGLMATAAVLVAGAATMTAAYAQTSTSAAPALAPVTGIAVLGTNVNLPGSGSWTGTPLQVRLLTPGTYELDADVRGRLQGAPPVNSYITARLWNVTAGAEVPQSERLVYQIIDGNTQAGGNQTAPISELVRVTSPTTIQLQAKDNNAAVPASIAQIYSGGFDGYTTLRFVRVGP